MKKNLDKSKNNCQHHWLPLVEVDENLRPKFGSLGSQIGYICDKCKKRWILWPGGHIHYGSEEELQHLNRKILQ